MIFLIYSAKVTKQASKNNTQAINNCDVHIDKTEGKKVACKFTIRNILLFFFCLLLRTI